MLIAVIGEKIRSLSPETDISEVMYQVEKLLDESIATEGYLIREPVYDDRFIDLSKIDFEALKNKFKLGHKHIEVEKIKETIARKLKKMVRLNRTRIDYMEKFQKMIDEYNAGSMNIDEFFNMLVDFAWSLNEEEQRSVREQLSEREECVWLKALIMI